MPEELQEMAESEPWFYAYNQQGGIVPLIDTEFLREVISKVPGSQEILLIHLQQLIGCIEEEKIDAPRRYLEALKDPDLALLETFCVDVELVDADLIEAVTEITSAEEAFSSEKRAKLKEIKNELDKQITLLWRDTKVEADVM